MRCTQTVFSVYSPCLRCVCCEGKRQPNTCTFNITWHIMLEHTAISTELAFILFCSYLMIYNTQKQKNKKNFKKKCTIITKYFNCFLYGILLIYKERQVVCVVLIMNCLRLRVQIVSNHFNRIWKTRLCGA